MELIFGENAKNTAKDHFIGKNAKNDAFLADQPKTRNTIHNTIKEVVNEEETTAKIQVTNNKGTELPETAGMGTTILYIIGALLLVGAGVLFVTRKRMAK